MHYNRKNSPARRKPHLLTKQVCFSNFGGGLLDDHSCQSTVTWVKVKKFEKPENFGWGPGGCQGPRWVQGKALVGGPGFAPPPWSSWKSMISVLNKSYPESIRIYNATPAIFGFFSHLPHLSPSWSISLSHSHLHLFFDIFFNVFCIKT